MNYREHVRSIRSAVRRLETDPTALDALVDWSRAEIWARGADADHVHVPVYGTAPWRLRVVRNEHGLRADFGGHTWVRHLPATDALLAVVLDRTAGRPMFDVAGWLRGEVRA